MPGGSRCLSVRLSSLDRRGRLQDEHHAKAGAARSHRPGIASCFAAGTQVCTLPASTIRNLRLDNLHAVILADANGSRAPYVRTDLTLAGLAARSRRALARRTP